MEKNMTDKSFMNFILVTVSKLVYNSFSNVLFQLLVIIYKI